VVRSWRPARRAEESGITSILLGDVGELAPVLERLSGT
jgi:hypothetical protein